MAWFVELQSENIDRTMYVNVELIRGISSSDLELNHSVIHFDGQHQLHVNEPIQDVFQKVQFNCG